MCVCVCVSHGRVPLSMYMYSVFLHVCVYQGCSTLNKALCRNVRSTVVCNRKDIVYYRFPCRITVDMQCGMCSKTTA